MRHILVIPILSPFGHSVLHELFTEFAPEPSFPRILHYLIPVKGSDTEWYKNLHKTPTLRVSAHGKTVTASAHVHTDQAQLDHVLELFREKYGRNVKSYYPKYDVAVTILLA